LLVRSFATLVMIYPIDLVHEIWHRCSASVIKFIIERSRSKFKVKTAILKIVKS